MRNVKKRDLPEKVCPVCGRPFAWRKKWAGDWPSVVYCSRRCRSAAKGSGRKPGAGSAVQARPAVPEDAAAIARIYNQGIEERVATFETRPRSFEEIRSWFGGRHPVVVVEDEDGIVAFAATSDYRPRACYAGVAEFSVYADRGARGLGAGRMAMDALIGAADRAGFWKLVSRVFVENAPSRGLLRSAGFREVGVYEKHARLDGAWRDVVIVERLLHSNL